MKDQTVAVVVNLDAKSVNKNTVSLFIDGVRVSEPKPLPEQLLGKPLFPHISYRNVTLQVNWGPTPLKELPFKCRMLSTASDKDVQIAAKAEPKDGKYDVVFPVCFPDEGGFDYLDMWLKKNPSYVELSDRKILEWAAASGLGNKSGINWKGSKDKPAFSFPGMPGMEDYSIQNVLKAVAPVVPRNYVIMEVQANLTQQERKSYLQRFCQPAFKKTAMVVVGQPDAEFKAQQQSMILKHKQDKADLAWKAAQVEKKRKKDAEQRQKNLAEMKRKAEKAKEEARKKKEAEGTDKDSKMDVDEAAKEDKKEDEPMEEKKDESEEETEAPKVELTDAEKALIFAPSQVSDLSTTAFNESFAKFSLPEKAEGFDRISYMWSKDDAAKDYLRQKLIERKRTSRVENLVPSEWFQGKFKEWTTKFGQWQAKQESWRRSPEKKAKDEAAKKAKESDEAEDVKEEGDLFSIENISDVGDGEPVFKDFALEDWALLQLRYELFLLQKAFKHDVNDEDRLGIHEPHLQFYYQRYFKKQLNIKAFGVENAQELAKLIKDTAAWEAEVLSTPLSLDIEEDVSYFVKLAEENRRERQRRIDAGDETARLKITQGALGKPQQQGQQGQQGGSRPGGWQQNRFGHKGSGKGSWGGHGKRQ